MKYLLPLLVLASPAAAEFSMTEGSFFKVRGAYDHTNDSFSTSPPEGEENACFQITAVDPNGARFDITLVSGDFAPWWADEVLKPGFTDSFVDFHDSGWRTNHPDGDWAAFMSQLLETVPNCPAPAS
ncbi:hypothetical protein L0666_16605 [Octadecabacter sp. CECT 8868]|uniref:hypothetical protein n=1 Tax=Octadecabacter algicola TaxID=2909342 RepID=UPI001F1B2D7D|nr:hypothetical protein [Octadecabacter algicola]MCF2906617.1 hypothetical protein [Octadecabacter algicola]